MFTVYTGSMDSMVDEDLTNVETIVLQLTNRAIRYERNVDAEQLFENVFGVRPAVFSNGMYPDCGDIISERGVMFVYVGTRMIKFRGGDDMFMDVQGK